MKKNMGIPDEEFKEIEKNIPLSFELYQQNPHDIQARYQRLKTQFMIEKLFVMLDANDSELNHVAKKTHHEQLSVLMVQNSTLRNELQQFIKNILINGLSSSEQENIYFFTVKQKINEIHDKVKTINDEHTKDYIQNAMNKLNKMENEIQQTQQSELPKLEFDFTQDQRTIKTHIKEYEHTR